MKKNRLAIIMFILGILLVICGIVFIVFFASNNTNNKSYNDNTSEKNTNEEMALNVIIEGTEFKKSDFEFVDITSDNEYRFLNKISSNKYKKLYYLVNLDEETYRVLSTVTSQGLEEG